jgi:hypothetical protein
MFHSFHCKQIATISSNTVEIIASTLPQLKYVTVVDFPQDVITVSYDCNPQLIGLVRQELAHLIRPDALDSSNIARMAPMTYLGEHTDVASKQGDPHRHTNSFKLHIPIITNDRVFMMWRVERRKTIVEHFTLGGVYVVNNIMNHCVINGGDTHRYYLTMRFYKDSLIDSQLVI